MATKHRSNSEVALAFVTGENIDEVIGSNLTCNKLAPRVQGSQLTFTHSLTSYSTTIAFRVELTLPDGTRRAEIWMTDEKYSNTTARHKFFVRSHAHFNKTPVYKFHYFGDVRWIPRHAAHALGAAWGAITTVIKPVSGPRTAANVRSVLSHHAGALRNTIHIATDNVPSEWHEADLQPALTKAKHMSGVLQRISSERTAKNMLTQLQAIVALEV